MLTSACWFHFYECNVILLNDFIYDFLFYDGNVLYLDCGGGSTTVFVMTQNCTLKGMNLLYENYASINLIF